MSPKTYKKLVATAFGENFRNIIEIVETDYTEPAPNEVLIRNIYAGVNFTDIPLIMGNSHRPVAPPFDLGLESVGEIVAVGAKVEHLKVGDCAASAMFGNGYRKYAAVDAGLVVPMPDATPEVLGLLISGVSASIALKVVARMQERQTVLVTVAAGDSGHYAVQLAKLEGNHVIGTCGDDDEAAVLKELGCDRIVNRRHENLDDVLKKEYPDGVNLIYESFGGKILDVCLDNIAVRGRLIIAGVIAEHTRRESAIHALDIYNKLLWKSATLHGFWLPDFAQFILTHAAQLLKLYQEGKIRSVIDSTPFKGLSSVADALEYINGWQSCGKVVVKI